MRAWRNPGSLLLSRRDPVEWSRRRSQPEPPRPASKRQRRAAARAESGSALSLLITPRLRALIKEDR